jgi:hypothetical protein
MWNVRDVKLVPMNAATLTAEHFMWNELALRVGLTCFSYDLLATFLQELQDLRSTRTLTETMPTEAAQ